MNALEKRTSIVVALIFFCRMMGLFMVLPIMSLYGDSIDGATIGLLGIAVGVYGLTQAILQIPVSMLSDRFGRKRIILMGLFVFLLGSLGAVFAENIYALIACRSLQGAGAIAGTSMALLADNSRSEQRPKVMAIVGISIGASFVLSLVAGPLIASAFGLQGVFIGSSFLAGFALVLCFFALQDSVVISSPGLEPIKQGLSFDKLNYIFSDRKLLALASSVFVLHLVMTAIFISVPLVLENTHGIARDKHWQIYLLVFIAAVLLMGPFSRAARNPEQSMKVLSFANGLMLLVLFCLALAYSYYWWLLALMCLYFLSFNLLEALLPSVMSQVVNEDYKASAMGMFSSFQFMGAFVGGSVSGFLMQWGSIEQLFVFCSILLAVSFAFTASSKLLASNT